MVLGEEFSEEEDDDDDEGLMCSGPPHMLWITKELAWKFIEIKKNKGNSLLLREGEICRKILPGSQC